MPHYDDRDRSGNTRLYVGRLSSHTRTHDLEDIFNRYGRVHDVYLNHDFTFIEFSDPCDVDEARYYLNGRDLDGSRIVVEFTRGTTRKLQNQKLIQSRIRGHCLLIIYA